MIILFCLFIVISLLLTGCGQAKSVAIIGGADGPTTVYLAGVFNWAEIIITITLIILVIIGIIFFIKKRKKK